MNKLYLLIGLLLLIPLVNASSYCDNVLCYSNDNGNPLKYLNTNGLAGNLTNSGAVYNESGFYYCDGINDYMTVPDYILTNDFTYIIRFKLNNGIASFIDQRSFFGPRGSVATSQGVWFDYLTSTQNVRAYVGNDTTIFSALTFGVINISNKYYALALTYNGTNTSVYTDGGFKQSSKTSFIGIPTTNQLFTICRDSRSSAYYANLTIDDVMVFNRSLSAAEVLLLYQNVSPFVVAPESIVLYSTFENNSIVTGTPSPILWCTKDEYFSALGTGTLYDSSISSLNLTENNAIYNNGEYSFNGINSYMISPDALYLNLSQGLGVCIYTNYTFKNGARPISTESGSGFQVDIEPQWKLRIYNSTGNSEFLLISNETGANYAGVYHDICISFDGSNAIGYIDGVYWGNQSLSGLVNLKDDTSVLYLGRYGSGQYYSGTLDNIELFNRPLSIIDINEYHQTYFISNKTSEIAHYTFSNGTPSTLSGEHVTSKFSQYFGYGCLGTFCYMNTADVLLNLPFKNISSNSTYTKDYSLTNNNVFVSNATFNTTDNSYQFNKITTGNYIQTSGLYGSNYSLVSIPQQSISLWFKIDSRNGSGIGSDGRQQFLYTSNINWRLQTFNLSTSYNQVIFYTVNSTTASTVMNFNSYNFSYNTWYNIVILANSTRNEGYVNGIYSQTANKVMGLSSIPSEIIVGGSAGTYNGSVDDIRLFNRSLSANEILAIYQEGRN